MAFERSRLGDGSKSGSGNVTLAVSNHYNRRGTGGEIGRTNTMGGENEFILDFNQTGPLFDTIEIPAGAVVKDVRGFGLTGSITTATVGSQDISAAREDDDSTWVTVTTAGDVVVSGPTAGVGRVLFENYKTDTRLSV